MKRQRPWISLLGFCVGSVLAAALAIAVVVAGASVALASHQRAAVAESAASGSVSPVPAKPDSLFTGMVTDSHCGARHMRNSRLNASECARACFRRGANYILVDGDKRYTLIGGEQYLTKLAGERANIAGTLQGNTILVDSAAASF